MSVRDTKVVVADGAFGAAAANARNKLSEKKPKGFSFLDLYYPVNEVLGSGAYARVETFRRKEDGNDFAVKIVEAFGNEKCRQKVFKEIEIYSLCSGHPHIIDLKEYFEEDGRFYLVFPKMNSSLFETIVNRGKLTEIEAANVVRQITSGLAYLHSKGIAHRDIKPENILAENEDLAKICICDFDLGSPVSRVREGGNCRTPALLTPVGSAEFMAPEVVDAWLTDNASKYDKKCDLWSLGVITYVLLCGYAPFNGNCGNSCGWKDLGRYCHECQLDLFSQIQNCQIDFPEDEWRVVSKLAKNFVLLLLVREARFRPSAVELLNNPWLLTSSQPGDKDRPNPPLLATPSTLKINSTLSLSFLLERSNDAYRRQSLFQDQLGDCLLAPLPAAKFRLGSDDEAEEVGVDDSAAKNGDYLDDQLSTTPRAGSGNLMALYTELKAKTPWHADDEYSNTARIENNYPVVDSDYDQSSIGV